MAVHTGLDRILADPAPTVGVCELADSSVNFVVRPWVKTSDYWPVLWDVTEKVKLELDKTGNEIPFPQTDMHLHVAGGGGATGQVVSALTGENPG